jgi:hypothetical protein
LSLHLSIFTIVVSNSCAKSTYGSPVLFREKDPSDIKTGFKIHVIIICTKLELILDAVLSN